MYQATLPEVLFCFVVWLIAMFVYLPALKTCGRDLSPKAPGSSGKLFTLFCFITFYSVFEFAGGDFYHYKEFYEQIHFRGVDDGLDPIYLRIIDVIPDNFYLWRFVVWGAAAFIWCVIIKRMGYSVRLAGCLFFLVVFFLFVGARQALAFSILYLGMIMLMDPKRRADRIVGLLLFLVSYFFHSTMIVYMVLLLFAFLPLSKRFIVGSILLFPVIYNTFDLFIGRFIDQFSMINEDSTDKMLRYLDSDFRAIANWRGMIRMVIDRLPILILMFYAIKDVFWNKVHLHKIYSVLLRMSYLLIYVSFLFMGREVSGYISPRFWDAAIFPLTLFLGGYLNTKRIKGVFSVCVGFLIASKLLTYLIIILNL